MSEILRNLPDDFAIGTSISSHQTEGDNRLNDWHSWEKAGHIPEAGSATNFWDDWRVWVDRASSVGNAFRISIEWSRVEPSDGNFDGSAMDRYREMLKYCKSKKLKTIVTLHHFTNPMWFAEKGGWSSRDSVKHFCRYVKFCAENLSGLVDYWLTVNEPQIYACSRLGVWPARDSPVKVLATFMKLIEAHREAYAR